MDVAAALAAGSLIKRSQTRESFALWCFFGFFWFFSWVTLGADCTRQVRRVEGAGLANVTAAATAAAGVDVLLQ